MVTTCSTTRLAACGNLRLVHNCRNGAIHGRGAKDDHGALDVHVAHMAASLSSSAMTRTSWGQTSRSRRNRPSRSINTSWRGHFHPMRIAVMMQAPAGPITLLHLRLMPTTFCCSYHACRSSSSVMASFQIAVAQATKGAASTSKPQRVKARRRAEPQNCGAALVRSR